MDAVDPKWKEAFGSRLPLYRRLKDEVVFALEEGTRAAGIKTHLVHGRVKELKSLAEKVRNKEYNDPIDEVNDIVGVRAVVLFLSDLPRLNEIITASFDVLDADNKISEGDPASFGYMSMHYVATLNDSHSGPRYDDLKGIKFEIQTRTIVMDAWANVSHYLDYKGESSVPSELRRDFFALSGLFYVADQHFEIFADRSMESQERAEVELKKDPHRQAPINLDTVAALLMSRYSERKHADRAEISAFVEEITDVGYAELDALAASLDAGEPAFLTYEEGRLSASEADLGGQYYTDVGAARLSLASGDQDYAAAKYGDSPFLAVLRGGQSATSDD